MRLINIERTLFIMRKLEEFVNEKLKVSKDAVTDEITYETFMEELQKLKNPDIYFGNYVNDFNGDYPKFQSWSGMNNAYRKLVGKKLKSIYTVRNIAGRKELHVDLVRRVAGTTGVIIENTSDLYNFLGEDQVLKIYDIIKILPHR